MAEKPQTLSVKLDTETLVEFSAAAKIKRARSVSSFVHQFVVGEINDAKRMVSADEWKSVVDEQREITLARSREKSQLHAKSEHQVNGKESLAPVVAHINPGRQPKQESELSREDAQRMIDDAKTVEKYPRKRPIDHVEPVSDERIAYVRNLGELTDERKQKPIRRKAGRK